MKSFLITASKYIFLLMVWSGIMVVACSIGHLFVLVWETTSDKGFLWLGAGSLAFILLICLLFTKVFDDE